MKSKPRPKVFIFKAALAGDKHIWRKIAIPGDHTLEDLHKAIFFAFDRFDEHLYSFFLTSIQTKSEKKIMESPEYASSMSIEEDYLSDEQDKYNAGEIKIEDLDLEINDTFYYLFDYGDEWWHEIRLENMEEFQKGQLHPQLVEARGKSPKQYPDPE